MLTWKVCFIQCFQLSSWVVNLCSVILCRFGIQLNVILTCTVHVHVYMKNFVFQRFGVKSDGRHSLSPVCSPAATSDGVCVSLMHSQPAASVSEAVGQFVVPGYPERMSKNTADYISVQHHEELLTRMLQSHMTGDLCLVGPRVSESLTKGYSTLHTL